MNLWFSTLRQRTSKCAGGAHWSIDVEMLYLTGRLYLSFYHSTGSNVVSDREVMSVFLSQHRLCLKGSCMGWNAQRPPSHSQTHLLLHFLFQHGLLHSFRARTEQAVCVAESLWSHHPERVHGAATAAFLLENRETE